MAYEMAIRNKDPWQRLWDFVSICGQQEDMHSMFGLATREIVQLVPCEQAWAIRVDVFPDGKGNVVSLETYNSSENAPKLYHSYYFHRDVARLHSSPKDKMLWACWRQGEYAETEIARDFIVPIVGIDMSAGLPLFDPGGRGAACLIVMRKGNKGLNRLEESILMALRPQIFNLYALYKRIEALLPEHFLAAELALQSELLSKREAEIAGLLCKRLRAHEIATFLMISTRTVETHTQHIYDKLNVRSRKELVHSLLGAPPRQGKAFGGTTGSWMADSGAI